MDWNSPPPEELEKPPLHPEGLYEAVVIGAEAGKTKNGKHMLKLKFRTKHGKLNGRLVFSPDNDIARRMWFRQLANMQVGKAFLDDGPEPQEVAEACLKAKVLITVKHAEYAGNEYGEVTFIDEVPDQEDAEEAG